VSRLRYLLAAAAIGALSLVTKPASSAAAKQEETYRAPLALWYGVALGTTWVPYVLMRHCTGYGCSGFFVLPLLRFGMMWAPALVHWNRDQVGRGLLSLGGQAAALVVGAVVGDALLQPFPCRSTDVDGQPTECGSPARPAFDGWLVADLLWAATDVVLTPATVRVESAGITSLSIGSSLRRDGFQL
jgi:hypothetical protein